MWLKILLSVLLFFFCSVALFSQDGLSVREQAEAERLNLKIRLMNYERERLSIKQQLIDFKASVKVNDANTKIELDRLNQALIDRENTISKLSSQLNDLEKYIAGLETENTILKIGIGVGAVALVGVTIWALAK